MNEILEVICVTIGIALIPTIIVGGVWVDSFNEKRTVKKLLRSSRVRTFVEAYVVMREKFEYYNEEITKRKDLIDKFIEESRFLPKKEWKHENEKLEAVRKEHFALLPDFEYYSEKLKNIEDMLREEITERVHPEDVDKYMKLCIQYHDIY